MRIKSLLALILLPLGAVADEGTIKTPDGEISYIGVSDKKLLIDEWHFSPARRSGDTIYVSGIVGGFNSECSDEQIEKAFEKVFNRADRLLDKLGSGLNNSIHIKSYHVYSHKLAECIDKVRHMELFRKAKDKFIQSPYPTWTAIGVSELIPDNGIVEVEFVVNAR